MFGQLIQQLQDAGNVQYFKYHRTCPVCNTTFGTDTRRQMYCCKECNFKSKIRGTQRKIIDEVTEAIRYIAMTRVDISKALKCSIRSVEENIAEHRDRFYIAGYKRVRGQFVPMFKVRKRNEKDMDIEDYKRKHGLDYTSRISVALTDEQLAKIEAKRGSLQRADYLRKLLEAA